MTAAAAGNDAGSDFDPDFATTRAQGSPLDEPWVMPRLQEIRLALADLAGHALSSPTELARRIAELEREYRAVVRNLEQTDPVAVHASDALRDDLADWAQLAHKLECAAAATAAERLLVDFEHDDLLSWQQQMEVAAKLVDPGSCFEGLLQTSIRLLQFREGEMGSLLETQQLLRTALVAKLRQTPAPEEDRDAWAMALADQAHVVLTTIDDLQPTLSAIQLERVADDLQWHLDQIESARSKRRDLLRRRLRAVRDELLERRLQMQLDRWLGRARVMQLERVVLLLLVVMLVVLTIEIGFEAFLSADAMLLLEIADALVCTAFMGDFLLKLAAAPDRWRWFQRNWLFGLLPALPFGLISWSLSGQGIGLEALSLLRLGQTLRFGRFIQLLWPLLRFLRAVGFLTRGVDRLARRLGPALNRNIILYPTQGERIAARRARGEALPVARRLRAEFATRWSHLVTTAEPDQRLALFATRQMLFQTAYQAGWGQRPIAAPLRPQQGRELPASELLFRLATTTPQDIEEDLTPELRTRTARAIRLFSQAPLCWFPLVSAVLPHLQQQATDAEVIAATTRRAAGLLRKYHERWFWAADLYGTVTPSQFIDRVGTVLINSSIRPVYRLLSFGGLFLVVHLIFYFLPVPELVVPLLKRVDSLVGVTLGALGGVCLLVLAIGYWLRRMAREATAYYERSAHAQFLSLTETIRSRQLRRDAEILYDRILSPEYRLLFAQDTFAHETVQADFEERVRQSLIGGHIRSTLAGSFDPMQRTVLLYRDALDGALLTDNDTRTTNQLLGNPSLRQLLLRSERVGRRELVAIEQLDLERQKSLLGGPFLWFNFISRAIAHSVARLILEYNRHAIPLIELSCSDPAERADYEVWLAGTVSPVSVARDPDAELETETPKVVTTAFTALHFLDVDPQRDLEVADRFGSRVLARLQRDRSLLVRRVFGTFPLHRRPKDQRVLNLLRLYESWLGGGRALLLPFFLFGVAMQRIGDLARWLWQSVQEVRFPELRVDPLDAAEADFLTAVRKIDRMRRPVVQASMLLRAKCDPEYLGLRLPNCERNSLAGADMDVDLGFIDADPPLLEQFAAERDRAAADLERLELLLRDGLLGRLATRLELPATAFQSNEHLRAIAVCYVGDLHGVRRLLSAPQILAEICARVAVEDAWPSRPVWYPRLGSWFKRYWKQHGTADPHARSAAWQACVHNYWGMQRALRTWVLRGAKAPEEGERRLAELVRHPSRITEQLVTLRTVQTLAMLDVLNYRQHVYRLGDYAQQGDEPVGCSLRNRVPFDTVGPR